jgi:AraC family ethanolamine operon transcriptional activator
MKTKGFDLAPTDTLVFGQDQAEMEVISKGNDHYGTFTLSQSAFFEIAEPVYQIDAKIMDADELILPHCQTGLKAIRQTVQEIETLVNRSPDLFSQRDTKEHCEKLLSHGFLEILSRQGHNTTKELRPAAYHRRQFLKRAVEYMQDHRGEAINLIDLCRAARASKRSLQYAFQEEYDMSPMTYLRITRLNHARRELLKGTSQSTNVTTIAFGNACYHLGRFAVDYRTLFGERPSETLCRTSTCRRR